MRAKIMTGCLALFISHLSFAEDETVLVINTAPTEFAKSVNEEINKMGSKYHLVKFKNNDSDQSSPLSDYLSLNIGSHTDAIEYIDLVCNKVTTSTRLDRCLLFMPILGRSLDSDFDENSFFEAVGRNLDVKTSIAYRQGNIEYHLIHNISKKQIKLEVAPYR